MQLYLLIEDGADDADIFLTREEAEASLQAVLADEPEWAGLFRVEPAPDGDETALS